MWNDLWKNQGAEDAKVLHTSWIHGLFFQCFLAFVESKKNYHRKSSTLKHAVVINSKF